MKNSISKSRFTPPVYKCIVVSLLVIALSIVLCSAGCSNVADSSSGSGGGGGSEPPKIGDVVMKDGSFKKASAASSDKTNAVAVVYKVAGGKAYAVGKVHKKTGGLQWCTSSANAYKKIDDLVTDVTGFTANHSFSGVYQDGSTGWTKLTGTSGVTDTGTKANYPAWYYCIDYGTTNSLPSTMQNGWYLPSIAELYDIWKNISTVDASLTAIGGDTFVGLYYSYYWSSSQYWAVANPGSYGFSLDFRYGECDDSLKSSTHSVCAVRVFTY